MNTLVTSLLLGCAGVLLAWLVRRPARRLMGPEPAFCLWLLPPLLGIVAWLPAWHTPISTAPANWALPPLVITPQVTSAGASPGSTIHLWFAFWLIGCAAMLARLVWHSLRIARHARPLPPPLRNAIQPIYPDLDKIGVRMHSAGPAVCWLPRSRLLLPPDLLERFDRSTLVQVLTHERMHLIRRDPLWSLLAEVTLAVLWFFPPAWLAISRFRLDQELACDAAILRSAPGSAGTYARALLTDAITPRSLATTTPWLSPSQLKERLTMIQFHSHTVFKARTGYVALGTALACCVLVAHATLPAPQQTTTNDSTPATTISAAQAVSYHGPTGSTVRVLVSASTQTPAPTATVETRSSLAVPTYRRSQPPLYPPAAIKKHEQGTVILNVLVDTNGQPLKVQVLPDTDAPKNLIAAAKTAIRKWRFTPAQKNGKSVKAWVRVPVQFVLPSDKSGQAGTHPAASSTTSSKHPTPIILLHTLHTPTSAASSGN